MLEAARTIQQSNLLVYAHADIIGTAPSSSSSTAVASKHSSASSPSRKDHSIPVAMLFRGGHTGSPSLIESDKRRGHSHLLLLSPPPSTEEIVSKPSSRRNSTISLLSNPADEEPNNNSHHHHFFVDISAALLDDPYPHPMVVSVDSKDVADDKSLSSTTSTLVSQTAMIDQIRLSATSEFNAPAPSHIEISMLNKDSIDAELQSVLFDIPLSSIVGNDAASSSSLGQGDMVMMVSDQPVVDSLMLPTNPPVSPAQNTSAPPTDNVPGPAKRKAHEKSLAAQQRLEDLKKKLLAEAPSDAVMAYNVRESHT